MAEYLAAVMTTLVLTGLFTYMIVRTDIEAIKGDWENRRCEFPVMVMAGLCKPDDVPKSAMEFAQDNFGFCVKKGIDSVLSAAFAPLYAIAGQQANVLGSFSGPMNSVRTMLKNAGQTFGKYMDRQYRQFTAINALLVKNWQHLLFSVGRIQSIFYGVVYLGLSMQAFVQNTIDLTMNAIMIFIGIMVAMIILLFFVLFPVIPMILTMITILVAAGFSSAAGMSGAFCINPSAYVVMANGKIKCLKNIKLGDVLASKEGVNKVTGILEVESKTIQLVDIEGILMSESHRVKHEGNWILANQHPCAVKSETKLDRLICLNTTIHEVPIISDTGKIIPLGDWEEVECEKGRHLWIDMVNAILNGGHTTVNSYPTAVPLVSKNTIVIKENNNHVPINSIRIGDSILGKNNIYTKVVGTYKGILKNNSDRQLDPEWMTDGVWIQRGRFWTTTAKGVKESSDGADIEGLFLVTESEDFIVRVNGHEFLVRDFTEVGASRIEETYDNLDWVLNKK